MNFAHLRTFVAIADHGGFGRAAARLNLTQSAASRQIQGLEAELGVKLFDRIGRGVQLTSEGEDLLRRASHLEPPRSMCRDSSSARLRRP